MVIGTYTELFDSPMSPWATLITLTIVVIVSMVRSAFEDNKRHLADSETNARIVQRLVKTIEHRDAGSAYEDTLWKDVSVGDIIRIENNCEVAADIVLLTTSETSGMAYTETSNIDGETNLKIKCSAPTNPSSTRPAWVIPEDLADVELRVLCELPNSSIHSFNGILKTQSIEVPLGAQSFLLRGSSLRNTHWAIGLVVYTGRETKLVMNSRAAPFKVSSIERTMNGIILVILVAQVLVSTISTIFYSIWKGANYSQLNYLCYNYANSTNEVYRNDCAAEELYTDGSFFLTFFILYSNFLPISMYVTVEICNYFQAYFIENDVELYDEVSDMAAMARTSNMNSDLGMVEYIFSDKTGTLTDNVMKFRRCSIGGVVYGSSTISDESDEMIDTLLEKAKKTNVGKSLQSLAAVSNSDPRSAHAEFVLVLALCHTMIVETDTGTLQAESPDELALVQAAALLGWQFVGRAPGRVLLRPTKPANKAAESDTATNDIISFDLLATIPFDSTRKRMSVVVRAPGGRIVVYCKGADNVMYARSKRFADVSAKDNLSNQSPKDILNGHLEDFSKEGLRTLVLAKKDLTEAQNDEFAARWRAIEKAITGRDELIKEAAALIETDLTILGATAIEDKLQDGVPQTILDLGRAGVKIWVLTGDKMETAINIGYSARILGPEMVLIRLTGNDACDGESVQATLRAIVNRFTRLAADTDDMTRVLSTMQSSIHEIIFGEVDKKAARRTDAYDSDSTIAENSPLLIRSAKTPSLDQLTSDHLALIVDGDTLQKIFGDAESEKLFLALARICKSVIACRVSPEQKRLVVRLVKRGIYPRPVTLSIGDGANDVAMIQEAQIGVGISGKEGRQAVNASDFAIAQFRFLKRLMLVHGRTDYRRTCKVVLYSFYKNIALTLVLFAYTFYSGYSGQSLFDDFIHAIYNLILAWPVVAFGVFDRDISDKTLLKYSILYVSGRRNLDLNIGVIIIDMLQALVEAGITFGIPYWCYIYPADVWGSAGYNDGIWVFGTTVYTVLVISMFLRAAMLTYTWTYVTHVCFWGSVAAYVLFLYTYQYYYKISYNYYMVTSEMTAHPIFWWLCLIVPATSAMLELTVRMVRVPPVDLDRILLFCVGLSTALSLSHLSHLSPSPHAGQTRVFSRRCGRRDRN